MQRHLMVLIPHYNLGSKGLNSSCNLGLSPKYISQLFSRSSWNCVQCWSPATLLVATLLPRPGSYSCTPGNSQLFILLYFPDTPLINKALIPFNILSWWLQLPAVITHLPRCWIWPWEQVSSTAWFLPRADLLPPPPPCAPSPSSLWKISPDCQSSFHPQLDSPRAELWLAFSLGRPWGPLLIYTLVISNHNLWS